LIGDIVHKAAKHVKSNQRGSEVRARGQLLSWNRLRFRCRTKDPNKTLNQAWRNSES